MKVKWFLDDKLIGESETDFVYIHGEKHCPSSYIRYCKVCGVIWNKVEVDHKNSSWIAQQRMCPKHGPSPVGFYNKEFRGKEVYEIPKELQMHEFKAMTKCGGESGYEAYLITGGM